MKTPIVIIPESQAYNRQSPWEREAHILGIDLKNERQLELMPLYHVFKDRKAGELPVSSARKKIARHEWAHFTTLRGLGVPVESMNMTVFHGVKDNTLGYVSFPDIDPATFQKTAMASTVATGEYSPEGYYSDEYMSWLLYEGGEGIHPSDAREAAAAYVTAENQDVRERAATILIALMDELGTVTLNGSLVAQAEERARTEVEKPELFEEKIPFPENIQADEEKDQKDNIFTAIVPDSGRHIVIEYLTDGSIGVFRIKDGLLDQYSVLKKPEDLRLIERELPEFDKPIVI